MWPICVLSLRKEVAKRASSLNSFATIAVPQGVVGFSFSPCRHLGLCWRSRTMSIAAAYVRLLNVGRQRVSSSA